MSPDYRIDPTATDGMLPWSWVREQATAARSYWICTTRPDGRPHAMPVWGLWLDETVFFSTDPASRKARNVAANPDAVIHLESGDEAVIFEGTIERVEDPEILTRFCDAYEAKYAFRPDPANPSHGVYRLRLCTVLAWREQDFAGSATRWRLPAI